MFETLMSALIPIIFIIAIGYAVRKQEYIKAGTGPILSNVVLKCTLPALLFDTFATAKLHEIWNTQFVIGMLVSVVVSFLITYKIARKFGDQSADASIAGLAVAWPNTVFLGIPLLVFIFGHKAILPIALGTLVIMFTVFPLTVFLIERNIGGTGNALLKAGLHKNPIILASILGLIFSIFDVQLPMTIYNSAKLLGGPTSTLALFATGIAIAEYKIIVTWAVIINVLLKNVLQPLLGLLFVYLFHLSGFWAGMLILNLACPSANTPMMLAYRYERYEREAVSTIIIGTIAFMATIFIFYPLAMHYN